MLEQVVMGHKFEKSIHFTNPVLSLETDKISTLGFLFESQCSAAAALFS